MENLYLGNNMLRICYEHGHYVVIEEYESWAVVFSGTLKECEAYCDERYVAYQVENVG